MSVPIMSIESIIARKLAITEYQTKAAIQLLDEGATVPFIARYRKEVTQGLDDTQLRQLAEQLEYLRELEARRGTILQSIAEQDKLTPELKQAIVTATTKIQLEDLYLPYRPKRHTKAQIAREAGSEPLALAVWQDSTLDIQQEAQNYLNSEHNIQDISSAVNGAQQILIEKFTEAAELINELREYCWQNATLKSALRGNKKDANKYHDYFDYSELLKKIPSHRALALLRGRRENALQLNLILPDEEYVPNRMASYFNIRNQQRPSDQWLLDTVRLAWKVKLSTKLELELITRLRDLADEEAIRVFARNLRDLLLAAPAGPQITIGLDPGIRTGIKVVVIDETGKLLDYTTLFPFPPKNEWHTSVTELAKLVARYQASLISIGNGTGSRETERLVSDLIKMYPDLNLTKITVSEAGASIYSASELAAKEFPDLDVSLRGAVSIARRLQDPLAELVKIEPKSIGVGQYQHDVNQTRLSRSLDGVVEDCVNKVGVDVNTASIALLTRVSGLNFSIAANLVEYRNKHGAFKNRQQLKNIPRMGDKTFEQSAGFLRIMGGDNPLDASAVHPEAYSLVEQITKQQKINLQDAIGNSALTRNINATDFVNEQFGLPTIMDVLKELEKPGRDPRPDFKTAVFKEGIEDLDHLEKDMILEGIVSNVTNFGAFVDIGVHQDGLVHISEITNRFISDPHSVVKAGDIVTVKVTDIDKERRRISLSMKLQTEKKPAKKEPIPITSHPKKAIIKNTPKTTSPKTKGLFNTTMADALAKLKRGSEV